MYCIHCGTLNADSSKFCMKCGQSLLEPNLRSGTPSPKAGHPSPASDSSKAAVRRLPIARRRRWLPWLAGGLALLLVLALSTIVLAGTWLHIGTNDAASLMPSDTSVLLSVSPSPLQARHWQRLQPLVGAFGAVAGSAGAAPPDLFGARLDIDLEKDVLPWIGFELAAGVTNIDQGEPALLAAIAVRSASGASEFTESIKRQLEETGKTFTQESYHSVDITSETTGSWSDGIAYAQTEGFLLVGSSLAAVRQAVDVAQGRSPALSADESYRKVLKALDRNRAGYTYVDWKAFDQMLTMAADLPMWLAGGLEGVGAAFGLEADGVRMDYVLAYDERGITAAQREAMTARSNSNRILSMVPDNPLLVANGQNLELAFDQLADLLEEVGEDPETVVTMIERDLSLDIERDIFSWASGEYALALIEDPQGLIGDPTTPFSFLVLIAATDRPAAERTMAQIETTLEYGSSVSFSDETIGDSNFRTTTDEYSDMTLGYGFVEDTLVIGSSRRALVAAAYAADGPLAQAERFGTATGRLPRHNAGYVYLDAAAMLEAYYRTLWESDKSEFDRNVRPFLVDLETIALASEQPSGAKDVQRGTIFIGLRSQ